MEEKQVRCDCGRLHSTNCACPYCEANRRRAELGMLRGWLFALKAETGMNEKVLTMIKDALEGRKPPVGYRDESYGNLYVPSINAVVKQEKIP